MANLRSKAADSQKAVAVTLEIDSGYYSGLPVLGTACSDYGTCLALSSCHQASALARNRQRSVSAVGTKITNIISHTY